MTQSPAYSADTPARLKRLLKDFCIKLTDEEKTQLNSMTPKELDAFRRRKLKLWEQ